MSLLDPSDCSLNILVGGPGNAACTTSSDGVLAYAFGGIRSPFAVMSGKFCFTCTIIDATEVTARDTEHLRTSCVARVGISQRCTDVGRLGEVKTAEGVSVGYNSTGKKVSASRMEPYGQAFGPSDRITVLVDLTGDVTSAGAAAPLGKVSYTKNGVWQGPAHPVPLPQSKEERYYPHILLRNCQAMIHLNEPYTIPAAVPLSGESAAVQSLEDQYEAWLEVSSHSHELEPQLLASCCEVIMMVGLPGSGKTSWARHYVRMHPEKRYMLLGPDTVLDQMRLLGLRQTARMVSGTSEDGSLALEPYMGLATAGLNQMLARAVEVPRNYILDQTNVSTAKRVARLAPFRAAGFQVKAALAAPSLDWLTLMQENSQDESGGLRLMPEQIMAELMAGFEVPFPGGPEGFADVILVHPPPAPISLSGDELRDGQHAEHLEEKLRLIEVQAVGLQRDIGKRWLERNKIQASDPQDQEQPGQEWPQPVQEQPRHGQQQQEQFQLPPLHQQHLHTAHLQPLQPQLEQSLFQAHALQASDGFAHAQAFQQHLIPAMQLQTAPAGGFMLPAQQQQPASFPQAPLLQPHFQLHVPFPPMHTQYPVAAHQQVQQQVPLPQGQLPFQPLHQVAPQPPLHINPMFTPGWG